MLHLLLLLILVLVLNFHVLLWIIVFLNQFSFLIKETFVFEKKEDDGDVKVCVEIVYDKELIKELYNIEGEENIKEFLWDKVKEVNKLMPKYKYVREMVITEEPLIKTTTLKIKRHEELKKVLGK